MQNHRRHLKAGGFAAGAIVVLSAVGCGGSSHTGTTGTTGGAGGTGTSSSSGTGGTGGAASSSSSSGTGGTGGTGGAGGGTTTTTKTETPGPSAGARIQPAAGSGVVGEATFTTLGTQVTLTVMVEGALEGEHGIHIHEIGDCGQDGTASGAV